MPVRTNLAAYWTNYRNIQIQTTLPNVTIASGPGGVPCTQVIFNANQCVGSTNDNVTLNAHAARIRGFEWEVSAPAGPGPDPGRLGQLPRRGLHQLHLLPAAGLSPAHRPDRPVGHALRPAQVAGHGDRGLYGQGGADEHRAFDELTLSARAYWQSRYEDDPRPYNAAQQTSPYTLVNLRLDLTGIGGRKVDLAASSTTSSTRRPACPSRRGC